MLHSATSQLLRVCSTGADWRKRTWALIPKTISKFCSWLKCSEQWLAQMDSALARNFFCVGCWMKHAILFVSFLFSILSHIQYRTDIVLCWCCFVCSAPGVGRKLIYASLIWRAETSISLKSLMWINSSWYSLVHVCRTIVYRLRFIFWKLAFFL